MLHRNFYRVIRLPRFSLVNRSLFQRHSKILCQCLQTQSIRALSTSNSLYCIKNVHKKEEKIPEKVNIPLKSRSTESVSEDLLEKLMAGLSSDYYQKNRVYKNDLVRVINKIKELNFSSKKQGLFLIQCCTNLLPNEAPANRMALAEEIWNILKQHTTFRVEHYNQLLKVYIANNRTISVSAFIAQMSPVKPDLTTYELFLKALGEVGDTNQATEVISNMKSQGLPATEDIFNSLILCQGKSGNIKNIQEVLTMMQSLKLEPSSDTYTSKIRAYAFNKKEAQVLQELEHVRQKNMQLSERQIMDIVGTLANMGLYKIIPQVLKYLPLETLNSPSISPLMQSYTTRLVYQNHPMVALDIYKCLPLPSFGPKDDTALHGRSLVRDCVKASIPTSVIGLITQQLMSTGRNPVALQCACEASLQLGRVPTAIDLLGRMKQLGMPVRPHYYWPILINSAKCYGEKGIMNTLQTMMSMDVKPDYETMLEYALPHVSFTSPQNLIKKFLEVGLTVSTVLTPVMEILLSSGQVRAASEIAEIFKGKIDADKLLKPLLRGYLSSLDVKSTIYILEDIKAKASQDKDWVGRFLCEFVQHTKLKQDVSDLRKIIKAIDSKKMKISPTAADFCVNRLPKSQTDLKELISGITDERLVDEAEISSFQIQHPKTMNEESLRAHLNELEAKGLNNRGVLRKLLQKYCQEGNLVAAKEIVDKCEKEGVHLSAGMRASIFDLHVKLGELELAEMTLTQLTKTAPNFTLDEFKVIDFATLMVYRKKITQAMELIKEQTKKRRVTGGRSIEMNCWRLLDATAANGTHTDVQNMLNLLTSFGYCKPNNILLGPLIRVHLKNNNIQEAVEEFTKLADTYNKTPLKHELLCTVMRLMNDGHSEENFLNNERANGRLNKMAQAILNADKKVHGPGDVQLTLISALAQVGYKKTLRQMFLDPSVKVHPDALLRRCERFADERNVEALGTLAECAKGARTIDVSQIYEHMLSVYKRADDCKEALALWHRMQELDILPSQTFLQNLYSMLKTNKSEIPNELVALLDDKFKSKMVN